MHCAVSTWLLSMVGVVTSVAVGLQDAHAQVSSERGVDYVIVQPRRGDARAAKTLYLNRCIGGCEVNRNGNRAQTNSSTIAKVAGTLTEFNYDNAAWQTVVSCVRELYAPYAIDVVDEEPGNDRSYIEVMVAGTPNQLGLEPNTLGIAPLTSDCSPQKNVLAFAFAGAHTTLTLSDLCSTAAHEAGHVFGLDHAFECRDPMTYLSGCGQKYFLNLDLPCGEFKAPTRSCKCSETQNSHEKLTRSLDAGTLPPAPEVNILVPENGSMPTAPISVISKITEKRWLSRVEFWVNGWLYATAAPKTSAAPVTFSTPRTLSDGILDIEIRAYNDLGLLGTDMVTVTKGAPCTATSCGADQTCSDGRCILPVPPNKLGDSCENSDQCESHLCIGTAAQSTCSQICVVGSNDQCGELSCIASADGYGVCLLAVDETTGGCCDGGNASNLLVALFVCGLLPWRRKRI